MGLRLRPVDSSFYDLFSQAAQHIVVGADLLAQMLEVGPHRQQVAEQMRDAEHAADETIHALVRRVNSTFVTPFDREDIYSLGSSLDDVMDMMEETVDLILLYEVQELLPEMSQQVEVIQRCAELTVNAMPNLQAMKSLEEYWIEINRLENAGDKTHRHILATLFSGEFRTIDVLKLKEIAESLESAIDAFEKVANIVEQIAVKES